jgi:hypothetical protein
MYYKEHNKYRDNKAKVFVIVLGQCTEGVLSRLENGGGLTDLEVNRDVKGLLEKLREIAFATGGVRDPYVTLAESFRRFALLQQGPKEMMAKYSKRFAIAAKVLDGHWGDFIPTNLADNQTTQEQAKDRFLSRMLLTGADKTRYGALIDDLNNSYIGKKDYYPESLEATLNLLSNYRDTKFGADKSGDKHENYGAVFAQKATKDMSKVKCHKCGKMGHYARDCGKSKSLTQTVSDEEEDDEVQTQQEENRRRSRSRSRSAWE